jgi:16S rRNA (cytosine967-C5)-methyltransferase
MNRLPTFRGPRVGARSVALQVLLDCRQKGAFVAEVLDRRLAEHPLSAADRRLATQLAYGVLRRRLTLQALVQPLVRRPAHRVEPWLWDALQLGTFQLTLLTHVPPHAALHETVELAAAFGRPGAKGFLNGILRRVAELVTDQRTDAPAADALPLEGGQYRRLSRPVLPDPVSQPVEYLAPAFGLPLWLCRRWSQRFGEEECRRLGFWFAAPVPLTLRCNPLRCSRDELQRALEAADVAAQAGDHPQAVRLGEAVVVRELPGYEEGWFSVQDESAMAVASALAPQAGETVLDLCAAPGGKATHLAELMGDRGRVVACDVDADRLATAAALAHRLGLSCVETLAVGREQEAPAGPFDRVLVDVPCSNTGVLGKRPEARWRLRMEDFGHLVALQRHLLRQATERVRPGGVVVYSTCSIEPEENRRLVDSVLREVPGLVLEAEMESVPGRVADGGYWARLRRGG